MDTTNDVTRHGRMHSLAVILASLIIPAPILVGKVVEAIMDSSNPARLDNLSAPLAYLTEILVSSFAVLGVVLVAFVIATIIVFVRSRSWRAVALPIVVAIIQIVGGVSALILNQMVSTIDGA